MQVEASGLNPNLKARPMRQSIQPTYDRRETGDRYSVEYRVNGRTVGNDAIADPFIRGTVRVGWRDLLRGLLQRQMVVEITVNADAELINDVMELDANCLIPNSTRQQQFQANIEHEIERLAMEPTDEELN